MGGDKRIILLEYPESNSLKNIFSCYNSDTNGFSWGEVKRAELVMICSDFSRNKYPLCLVQRVVLREGGSINQVELWIGKGMLAKEIIKLCLLQAEW